MPRWQRLLVILGGPAAEAMATAEDLDRDTIDQVDARALTFGRSEHIMRRAEGVAACTLTPRWRAVERLAAALARQG